MKKKFSLFIIFSFLIIILASCSFIDKAFKIEDNITSPNNEETKEPSKEVKDDIKDGFSVTFNNNGHGKTPTELTNIKKLPNPLPVMEEKGYDFLGWAYNKDLTNIAKSDDIINENKILYAIWKQKTYTITYDANGHGTSPSKEENQIAIPDTLPILEDDGYEFLGWSLIKNSNILVKPGDLIESDTKLYAVWEEIIEEDDSYSIYFLTYNHGTSPKPITGVTEIPEELPILIEEGYIFLGWSLEYGSNLIVKPGEPISSNIRLYAVWEEETYTITFDENGHGVAPKKIMNVKAIPDSLPTIKFDGYKFIGWTLNTKTNVLVEEGTEISSNIKLYAVWEKNKYTVSYDSNGHGSSPTSELSSTIPNPLPILSENGYTFKGWSKSEFSTTLVKAGADIDGDITLYGVWKKNTYRITYHNNGRGEAPNEQTGVTSLPNPLPTMTVEDYNFLGWGLSYNSTKDEAIEAGQEINSNVELYAIWELKTYDITYDENGHGAHLNKTIGTRNIPEVLPTLSDDDYDFLGWSLEKDSTTLVEAGKKLYNDITLYAVWVLKEATITSIDMASNSANYIKYKVLDANNIDEELSKIVYIADYSDSTKVEITIDKTMLSDDDYNNLKTKGTHEVTFNILGNDKKCTLETDYYWQIAYYVNGDLYQQAYPFRDGTNANTPSNPKDYLDEFNVLWTFDRWDQSDEAVSKDMDINAIFKKVDLFNYNVVINSIDKATLSIDYDKVRVTGFNISLIDEETLQVVNQFDELSDELELSNLDSDKSYKIKGTYTFIYNEESYDYDITETVITTKLVEDLENVDYAVDTRSISSNVINLDVSKYAEAAPIGYELSKVYLIDVDEEKIAGEFNYSTEDTIAYFDGLNSNKEYQTIFYYGKINENQFDLNLARSAFDFPTEIKFNPEYGFCFMGFRVYTSSDDENMKEVKLVYKDPARGEKILYRYYVNSGANVPYSTFEYSNPFTFALPLIYKEYYAFGDYSELLNITDDKTVEVHLVRKSWISENKHTLIFVGYSDKDRYDGSQYIIRVVEVNDGESVTPPTNLVDYDAYLPAETDKYKYEASWETRYSPFVDLDNVEYSAVLYSSPKAIPKEEVTVLKVPQLEFTDTNYSYNKLVVNDDSVITYIYLDNPKAILGSGTYGSYNSIDYYKGIDVYLTEGSLNSNGDKIKLTTTTDYPRNYKVSGLDGVKYVIHYVYRYDINDGTGVHTIHYAIPFSLGGVAYDDNVTGNSPNYQTIKVTNSDYNDDESVVLIPDNLGDKSFEYYYYFNNYAKDNATYINLKTYSDYRLYTVKKFNNLCVYKKVDGESRIFTTADCITTVDKLERISTTYKTIKTMNGVEPEYFILEVPGSKSGDYYNPDYDSKLSDLRLIIGNYQTQIDIGTLRVSVHVFHEEFANDPERNHSQLELEFVFDSEKGYYTCANMIPLQGSWYDYINEVYRMFFYRMNGEGVWLEFNYYYNIHSSNRLDIPKNQSAKNPTTPQTTTHIRYYEYVE